MRFTILFSLMFLTFTQQSLSFPAGAKPPSKPVVSSSSSDRS